MTATCCNDSTQQQPFAKTICSICNEDLKPIVEDLQAISIYGQVFHELWGYKRFLTRVSLEASDYLKDDCLSMHCTVGVVRNRVEGPRHFTISVPPSGMGQNLKCLLETETGCDIVVRIGDENFKAHKLILAARSPVFRAQVFGLVGNTNMDEVELKDVEPSIFRAMLMFVYSDTLPDSQDLMGSTSMCTSTNIIPQLLAAADRFGLDRLKQLCEAKLCEEVNVETVATTLSLADLRLPV